VLKQKQNWTPYSFQLKGPISATNSLPTSHPPFPEFRKNKRLQTEDICAPELVLGLSHLGYRRGATWRYKLLIQEYSAVFLPADA